MRDKKILLGAGFFISSTKRKIKSPELSYSEIK
jgi:hypothetical protein